MTRRAFLARAAALALSASGAGAMLSACEQTVRRSPTVSGARGTSPTITSVPAFGGTPPVINPPPSSASYGPMLETSALVPVAIPSAALRALLDEVAAVAGIPIAPAVASGSHQAGLTVVLDNASLASQAYRLEIAPTADGALVTIRAGGAAGAYYGLLSLAQLTVTEGSGRWLRAVTVSDAPGFARRGVILDPWVIAAGGMTDESKALLLERVRFGVRHKLNFVDLPGRTPWPELVRYCDEHYVELMVGMGYQDWLTTTPREQVKEMVGAQLVAGVRSIALCWDDIRTIDPEALARQHADIFVDLYDDLRSREPGVHVSTVLPPYGGIPGHMLVGSAAGAGERYLAIMKTALPADVRVFWTGDGGVFSPTVTAEGARAYADAVGHDIGLWDNDTIRFSTNRQPCSGRSRDLSSVVHACMGNLAGEANWQAMNGAFALLTSLFYTWNPATYVPAAAAASADLILAREPVNG